MNIKSVLSRLGLSNRQQRAEELIDIQVSSGKSLATRIENLRGKDQNQLPRESWVSEEEILAWRRNCRNLIEELFGDNSQQITSWENIWNNAPPSSAFDKHPEDVHLNRISQINAHIGGLKTDPALSRNAIERIRDQLARHPILGGVFAIAGILATGFALIRGMYWIITTFFG